VRVPLVMRRRFFTGRRPQVHFLGPADRPTRRWSIGYAPTRDPPADPRAAGGSPL